MALKQIEKFNIKRAGTRPANLTPYGCFTTGESGIWLVADRNDYEITDDPEGQGLTDVTVFLKFGKAKVCAPGPPFDTNDGG